MRSSCSGIVQCRKQLRPLLLSTYQGGRCHEHWMGWLLFPKSAFVPQETLVDLTCGPARLCCQFTFQEGRASMVDAQRGSPVAAGRVETHQVPVGSFVQGVMA